MDTSLSFANVLEWLNDPANWQGPDGVVAREGEQVYYRSEEHTSELQSP